jgi:hypothetical protein
MAVTRTDNGSLFTADGTRDSTIMNARLPLIAPNRANGGGERAGRQGLRGWSEEQ